MLVSVVMAVYNGQEYLREAIDSVLLQTYTDIELIIVNDASTDRTKEILEQIIDERVKMIHLEKNEGAASALNLGIGHAKGKWIAIHDADDISYPKRIEKQVGYLNKHPDTVAVSSFIKCIHGRNNLIPQQYLSGLEKLINRVQTSEEIKSDLYTTCPLTHGTIMFSKKAFVDLGKYDSILRISYDYDLWTRLIPLGKIEKLPEKLYKYRVHNDSLTNNNLVQNINEMFFSCAKYVRNTCYETKKERPAMIVFGPKNLANNFAFQARDNLNVLKVIYKNEISFLPRIITLLKQKKLDGAVMLSNYKYRDSVFSYLTKKGMELNKNLFEFWIWF